MRLFLFPSSEGRINRQSGSNDSSHGTDAPEATARQQRVFQGRAPQVGTTSNRDTYFLALLLAIAGVYIRFLLNPALGADVLTLSMIGVACSAWFGGFGPGALTTVISVLGGIWLGYSVNASGTGDAILTLRLLLFLVTGLILSFLTEALSQATLARQRAEHERETRVLEERNRMARDIHDTLAHGLTGIIIQLEAAEDSLAANREDANREDANREYASRGEAERHVERARAMARSCLSEARRSVHALRPEILEQFDLFKALRYQLDLMTEGTPLQTELLLTGAPHPLPPEIENTLLRIALEACTNTVKHAQATHLWLEIAFNRDQVRLTVRDDGRGFTPYSAAAATRGDDAGNEGGGMGLPGMQERAGRIGGQVTVSCAPGNGTTVLVTVPLALLPEENSPRAVRFAAAAAAETNR